MGDEVRHSSGADTHTNKRKYDDRPASQQLPSSGTRRPSGFSSAPVASSPSDSSHAASYNSVPPPMDEIQLAKQRAQEIAARLFNTTDPKRPRVENGGSYDSSTLASDQGSFYSSYLSGASTTPYTNTYQSTCKKIEIPNTRVGVIIGKSGETIKYLQLQSGAKIQVTRDMDADPNSPIRLVDLVGTPDQIAKAEQLISDVLAEAESGGSGIISRRVTGQPGTDQFVMKVPNNKVGLIIGKGGETIKNMQASTGCRIQVIPLHPPPGDTSLERIVQIDGTAEQIESAKQLVNEVISENRLRNQGSGGSGGGYQARPATSWAPPVPAQYQQQQQGYGYYGQQQQLPLPGSAPQYQQGYGYPTGWDMSSGVPQPPAAYDYYSQQQQLPPPPPQQSGGASSAVDTAGYGYTQQQTPSGYTQGYAAADPGGYHYGQGGGGGYEQQGYGASNPPASSDHAGYADSVPGGQPAAYAVSTTPATATTSQQLQTGFPPSYATTGYGSYGKPTGGPSYAPQQQQQQQLSPSSGGSAGYAAAGGYSRPQLPPTAPGYADSSAAAPRAAAPTAAYATAGAAQPPGGYLPGVYAAPPPYTAAHPPPYMSAYAAAGVYPAAAASADGAAAVPHPSPPEV